MYRPLSIIIITASLVWLFGFLKKNQLSFDGVVNNFWNELTNSSGKLKEQKSKNWESKLLFYKRYFYLSTLFLFLLMAISAFIPVLIGSNLSDIFLLTHVTVAPLFSVLLAISIVLFAHSNKFSKNDFEIRDGQESKLNLKGYLKVIFWLFALFSVSAMLSIVLSMFPILGTEGQVLLLDVHKYSTLLLLLLVIFHAGLITANSKQN
jgi:ABC-type multidrug transport system fused ATPase/permease subunit